MLLTETQKINQKFKVMKNLTFTFLVLFIASFVCQTTTAQDMSNREMRKKLRLRPPREVRREARDLEKEGYKVAIGAPTIERQLLDSWLKQQETDGNGYPKFIVASATSVGETQIAAKLHATEAAKLDLAGQIATNVAALIENNIANSQLNTEEAASVTKTVAASKSIIAQELGRTLPLVELYRNIGKNMEANISIAYSQEMAMETAKKTIRKRLEEETEILQEKLEELMKF
jgi:SOS-response transcriptional repressor LexA